MSEMIKIAPQANVKVHLILLVALLAVVLLGGVRFSDGSLLLAIAEGGTVEHPAFTNPASQYIWDSPLKVYMLKAIPPSILIIAAIFAFLGILPSFYFFQTNPRILVIAGSALLMTPAFKISIQNLGAGYGLTIALIIVACLVRSPTVIFSCMLFMGIWHPQQAICIGVSWIVGQLIYCNRIQLMPIIVALLGLCTAALFFFGYRIFLGFTYADRLTYMLDRATILPGKNLPWAIFAFLPSLLWFLYLAPETRYKWGLTCYLVGLAVIALFTTDVTAVFTTISLPLVALGASKLYRIWSDNGAQDIRIENRFIIMFCIVLLLPPYSWSGFDIFVWNDLIADFCKWTVYCLN